ncbi:toxin glutamine deamidase domain-containing protein [Micromonospora sp. NPDC023956]|uniref:toxin glutamine deamidase domain-containing protein n=1 Tax=Micromonospora sp. NPDC023956 TaxID=3155722 RepID=UPI0033CC817A
MTVLPSPIPHPLDFCPWQLPGWVYEALDWVVGVEWPEGNERAVWDLADEWYGVAAALAGPRDDAVTAAGEVLSGYGAVGAVADAFDTAWRKVAEGDEAPLPLLLSVSTDLGRLVEECGCDIEGAKLEVWIELGILVVELLAMTVAVVLTAGAASPAAAAAITATRFVVQQIFKKLIAQLARKTLRKGMQEATERAAKQVTRDGLRGLGRNALRGGLLEAAQEGGVNLAIQGYQNSTGRRDGVDLTDLGTSALGGLAGGAAAPLAGLGKHASSRGGQFAENLGREMGGEVVADQAASLATGGGLVGLEDAARAAASGATGSVVSQSDAALQARLAARTGALDDTSPPVLVDSPRSMSIPPTDPAPSSFPHQPTGSGTGDAGTNAAAPISSGVDVTADPPSSPARSVNGSAEVGGTANVRGSVEAGGHSGTDGQVDRRTEAVSHTSPAQATAAMSSLSTTVPPPTPVPIAATPSPSSVSVDPVLAATPATAPAFEPAGTTSLATTTASTVANAPTPAQAGSIGTPNGTSTAMVSGPTPVVTSASVATSGVAPPVVTMDKPATASVLDNKMTTARPNPSATVEPASTAPGSERRKQPDIPMVDLSKLEALAPEMSQSQSPDPLPVAPEPTPQNSTDPPFRSREWYETRWEADREELERRRYRGYYEAQRAWFEDRRRDDLVRELRSEADAHYGNARWFTAQAHELHRAGKRDLSDQLLARGREEERLGHRQTDLAEEVREGSVLPDVTFVDDYADFRRINDDVAGLAEGGVDTGTRSALTGKDVPPSIDQDRPYGERGGLRPPLALHQTDLEQQMPRKSDGRVIRTADPRRGRWFSLVNDGGPSADATRGINCLDCTLSLYETWVHGRPRVSAPRTFDGYFEGNVNRPIDGEWGGPGRVERATGGVYQRVTPSTEGLSPAVARQQVMQGYADLHRQLLTGGHGSFAFLVNTWEGGGAHAWVALNQNGTVLYLDPQIGTVSDRPPYFHRGVAHTGNVASLEALVVGPDGKPLPLPGREVGDYSEQRGSTGRPSVPVKKPHPRAGRAPEPPGKSVPPSGADPRDRTTGPSAMDGVGDVGGDPSATLSEEEWQALVVLHGQAAAAADEVELILADVAGRATRTLDVSHPIELRDRQHRLKTLNSLARKFHDESAIVGASIDDFVREVNDVLRFSFVLPAGGLYTDAVALVLGELSRLGCSVADDDCKNFWRAGNRFYGFNCTIRSPSGQLFELQLHTEASRRAWLATHHAYEVLRRAAEPAKERVYAFLDMLALNRAQGMPQAVPQELFRRFPPKDASFAKWISRNRAVWTEYRRQLRADGLDFREVVASKGLTRSDFPIAGDLMPRMESDDVDVLRGLRER